MAFVREVLDPQVTARTPRFDDYTAGSYHVNKASLPTDLANVAAACHFALRGVVIIGPVGPLWAYYVVAFIDEGDSTRITSLVMPHARITGKGTSRVSTGTWPTLLAALRSNPRTTVGLPTCVDSTAGQRDLGCEFSYDLQITSWDHGATQHWHARLSQLPEDSAESLLRPLNALLAGTITTYEHGRLP